ncbi:MAG TPA: DinB family protein [Roseiflexaceae bacterium]|nr:DinB family protein [Roseiflexaceae bacterium]
MSGPITLMILERQQKTHRRLLEIVHDLSETQLNWRPDSYAPSIGFHLWHMARWADRLQATLPAMTIAPAGPTGTTFEIWEIDGLARRWEWPAALLGYGQTGMEMSDEMVVDLKLPHKHVLMDYAREAFAAADRAVSVLEDYQLEERGIDIYGQENTVGYVLLVHLSHASRHLGMIECLRGVQGLRGTATV